MTRRLELDGLRGVAILLVVAAHTTFGLPPGNHSLGSKVLTRGAGLVGVQVFFALSGFLITMLLLAEADERGGRIELVRFYMRRVRRLFPALLVVCLGCLALAQVFTYMQPSATGDVLLAASYTTNLGIVAQNVVHGPWLGHTWSLAVEEQFYLVWPVLLIVGYRVRGRRGVAAVALAGIALTIILREALVGADIYRSMRWDALLWGCWLATAQPRMPRWLPAAGAAMLVVYTVWMPTPLEAMDYTVTAAASCLVVAGAPLVGWLKAGWLRYFGSISYGLYLWHVMLIRLDLPAVVTVGASLVISDLSFRFVERPILQGRKSRAQARPTTWTFRPAAATATVERTESVQPAVVLEPGLTPRATF